MDTFTTDGTDAPQVIMDSINAILDKHTVAEVVVRDKVVGRVINKVDIGALATILSCALPDDLNESDTITFRGAPPPGVN